MARIKVYGADWCPLTAEAREHLDELGVDYEYIDIEKDSAAAKWVKAQNGGKEKKPTIDIDGVILPEPSNRELDAALERAA
jgi:glutaredoxin